MAKETKHAIKFRENHLKANEKILAHSNGYIGETMGKGSKTQHNGVLIATTERIIFYRKGLLGEVLESIPIVKINSIERKSGILQNVLSFHGSGNRIVFKSLEKADNEKVASAIESIQNAEEKTENQESKQPKINNEDAFEKIKKLAELKEMGVINEDEFNEKKSQLLTEI